MTEADSVLSTLRTNSPTELLTDSAGAFLSGLALQCGLPHSHIEVEASKDV
jgi:hypothetical protein